jgi:hypothetical protein
MNMLALLGGFGGPSNQFDIGQFLASQDGKACDLCNRMIGECLGNDWQKIQNWQKIQKHRRLVPNSQLHSRKVVDAFEKECQAAGMPKEEIKELISSQFGSDLEDTPPSSSPTSPLTPELATRVSNHLAHKLIGMTPMLTLFAPMVCALGNGAPVETVQNTLPGILDEKQLRTFVAATPRTSSSPSPSVSSSSSSTASSSGSTPMPKTSELLRPIINVACNKELFTALHEILSKVLPGPAYGSVMAGLAGKVTKQPSTPSPSESATPDPTDGDDDDPGLKMAIRLSLEASRPHHPVKLPKSKI